MNNTCVCCGELIPEGRQVCPACIKQRELKPCPFCGNEKLKLDRKSKFAGCNGLDMRVEQHTYSVRCNVCHARGGAVGGKVLFGSSIFGKDISPSWATTDAELKEKAREAWNRRAGNEQREAD